VAHVVLTAVLALASITAAVLARSALRCWWAQRAGRPYELPVRHGGTVLRAAGSAAACAVAMTLLLAAPGADQPPPRTGVARFVAAPPPATALTQAQTAAARSAAPHHRPPRARHPATADGRHPGVAAPAVRLSQSR
jgi:hypothetical protein